MHFGGGVSGTHGGEVAEPSSLGFLALCRSGWLVAPLVLICTLREDHSSHRRQERALWQLPFSLGRQRAMLAITGLC
eukprot:CAMPEP_0172736924 /NCGR_PEP_ID=MMETSP1074-20121228/116366_1 /TAXON_ID=2916 /ORGANISM="Ceratium fusus, Strain PA161109" /LENGTH=76 /DNA_ID=CAMNT_0013566221 /DNA_START=69 /DNA_END=296 /DNA_ORIENTATION=+